MAFHPHPQLIQKLFNAYWFGPPYGVTHTSAWPRVDHLVSRLPPPTKTPCSDSLSLRLRVSRRLTSPATATRRFIMQKARRHTRVLRPLVGAWFQGLFHSPVRSAFHLSLTVLVRVLFTFPSRYLFAIGLSGVFSLAGWSRRIRAGFHVPRVTQGTALTQQATRKGLSPAAAALSSVFRSPVNVQSCGPTTPAVP